MQRAIFVVVACVLIIALFFVFDVPQKLGFVSTGENELQPVSSIVMTEDEAKKLDEKVPILLYFADKDGKTLAVERRYILRSDVKSDIQNAVMKELLKGPSASTVLKAALPADTKLATPVKIKNGVATVNLSKEFAENFPKNKDAQALAIYSIVNTLSELKEVSSVKFLVSGVQKKELGSFKFNAAFQKSGTLIDKSAAVFSTGIEDILPTANTSTEIKLKKEDSKKKNKPGRKEDNNKKIDINNNDGSQQTDLQQDGAVDQNGQTFDEQNWEKTFNSVDNVQE